jgi:hypothetical protein
MLDFLKSMDPMKKVFIFIFMLTTVAVGYSQNLQKSRVVWVDEFNQDGLPDLAKWDYDVGGHGWGNNELQYYSKADLKNARVEKGVLIIEAHADTSHPKGFSSARLGPRERKLGNMDIFKSR